MDPGFRRGDVRVRRGDLSCECPGPAPAGVTYSTSVRTPAAVFWGLVEPNRFVPWGPDHLAALALTATASVGLSAVARRAPEGRAGRAVRFGLAGALLSGVAAHVLAAAWGGTLSLWDLAPLHLCDLAIFVAVVAILTRRQLAFELLYFWACAGTLLAMITPDVWYAFPNWGCILFFGLHGAVVVTALTLTAGFGMRPRAGASWRVFLITLAYAALVGLVNLALGTNYMYLREKPLTPTLLDAFGPWPGYLIVAAGVGLALFLFLELPFRFGRPQRR